MKLPKYYPKTFISEFYPNNSNYSIIFTKTSYAITYNHISKEKKRKKINIEDLVRLHLELDYYKKFFNIK